MLSLRVSEEEEAKVSRWQVDTQKTDLCCWFREFYRDLLAGGTTSRNFDGAMDWLNQTRLGQTMLACECSSATVWPDTRLLFLEAQPLKKGCGVRHSSTDTIVPLLASNRTQVGACALTSGADQHLPVLTLIKHRVSACPHRRADHDFY